jgi:hypothetical protein
MNADPFFIAAYNAWQQEARESTKLKLMSLVKDAVDAVKISMDEGDGRLALTLLKELGLLTKVSNGPTDPEAVSQQIQIEEANRKRASEAAAQPALPPPSEPPK